MNRITIALLAALEAVIAVAIGLGLALVPLTILWATQGGLSTDWTVFWRAASDVWLLGHGVDLTVQLPPAFVTSLALPGADAAFTLSLALLGFAVLTVILGVGAGRRAAHSSDPLLAALIVVSVFCALAIFIALSAGHELAMPAQPAALVLPGLIYASAVVVGLSISGRAVLGTFGRNLRRSFVQWSREMHPAVLPTLAAGLRGGTIAAAVVVGFGALLLTISMLANYATMIGLYESLQAGVLGGIVLTVLQLALLPNAAIWAASWVVGPGFAVGAGTSVSPGATVLGPVPGLPLFAALPTGQASWGFLVLLVPILAGFVVGVMLRQRLPQARPTALTVIAHGSAAGITAGIILALLAWFSAGAGGPGRLQQLGPDPLMVGLFTALEVGVPAVIGLFAGAAVRALPGSRAHGAATANSAAAASGAPLSDAR